jgi:hypothetical protein
VDGGLAGEGERTAGPLATVLAGEAGRELLTRFEALSGDNPTLARSKSPS